MTAVRVLIDAVNVRATGPLALVRALIPALHGRPDLECTGLVPDGPLASLDWPHGVEVVPARQAGWGNRLSRVADIGWRVQDSAVSRRAQVTLSLGDIGPLFGTTPSVLFLHNALLVGRESRGVLQVSRMLFRRSAHRAARILVQSPVMADALRATVDVDPTRIEVVPHPPPTVPNVGTVPSRLQRDQRPCRLLYLAAYYPHKRHDLIPEIVRSLRQRGVADQVTIYVTIADTPDAVPLLKQLGEDDDVVVNLGAISGGVAAAAMQACDGLLHLSDAESYGMTLIEALRADRDIVAPDLPYARWLCGDAANYFAPGDGASAAAAIHALLASPLHGARAAARGTAVEKLLPTWDATAAKFADVLCRAVTQR